MDVTGEPFPVAPRGAQVAAQAVTAILYLAFVALAVGSFIQARRARDAG